MKWTLSFLILFTLNISSAQACTPPGYWYDQERDEHRSPTDVLSWMASLPGISRGPVIPAGDARIVREDWGSFVVWPARYEATRLDAAGNEYRQDLPAEVRYKCNWNCLLIQPFRLENRGTFSLSADTPQTFGFGGSGMCTQQYQVEGDLAFSDAAWAFFTACREGRCPTGFEARFWDYKQARPHPYGLAE